MAIKLFDDLRSLTFSGLKRPDDANDVLANVLKLSLWGALGTGCVAGASAIFSGNVIVRSAIAPYVFKASLSSCGALTVFAICLIYKFTRLPDDERREPLIKKLNAQALSLENTLVLICTTLVPAAMLSCDYLNLTPMIKSLAERSIHPLWWIGVATWVIQFFHSYQHLQMRKQ
jgi:hypothetical protein